MDKQSTQKPLASQCSPLIPASFQFRVLNRAWIHCCCCRPMMMTSCLRCIPLFNASLTPAIASRSEELSSAAIALVSLSADQSIHCPIDPSTNRSIDQSAHQPIEQPSHNNNNNNSSSSSSSNN